MSLGRRPARDPRALTRALVRRAREIAAGITTFADLRAWFAEHVPER